MMRRTLFTLAALATLAACKPPRAGGTVPPPGRVEVARVTVNAPGDTVYVPGSWIMGQINDGFGQVTSFEVTGRRVTPGPALSTAWASHPAAARNATVPVPMPARLTDGQTATGTFCVRPVRLGKAGPEKCAPWSLTFSVPAPPPVDSAWTGPPATQVAFGYAPRHPRNPQMDEPFILGVAFPIYDTAGVVADAYGFCVARTTSSGRTVTRPTGTDWDARYRRYCDEHAARFWPGRTVVSYALATAAERAELAEYRCVHFLVECGDISRCRKPAAVGCDSLGWRVVPTLEPWAMRIIGVVPRSA